MEIPGWKRKTPFLKEWDTLCKKEQTFSEHRMLRKESGLNQLLAERVPEKLQHTLDIAFEKAFRLIFQKGTGIIEKTFNRDALKNEYKVNLYADEIYHNRKSLRAFSKNANRSETKNLFLSGAAGVSMGILGIGLPDIPVFTGMVLKCIYEIALHYGFDYNSETEKYFILLLIEGAVSYGDHFVEINHKIETFFHDPQCAKSCLPEEQIAKTSGALSKELLYMKFLQGIPVAGVLGGVSDIVYMKQISEFAKIKYQKRFLQIPKSQEEIK